MGYLLSALAAPVAGPLLYRALHPRERWVAWVDNFVYLAVPTLVALQVLPVAVRGRTPVPIALLGAGLLVPTLFERASRALAAHTDLAALLVAFSGLGLHALLEGAGLRSAAPGDLAFGGAIVLHRMPVGLMIWWLVRPRWGFAAAVWMIASLVVLTLAGWTAFGMVAGLHGPGAELYQAFVGGSLLHVVFHQGRQDHAHYHGADHGHERTP